MANDQKFVVRYCNDAPATLRRWIDAHPHIVQEFDCGDGYATDSGFAYDILLRPGYRMGDDFVHTLIEPTVALMLRQLRGVATCDCDECRELLGRQKATAEPEPQALDTSAAEQVLIEGSHGYTYSLPATHARQVMIQANRARSAELRKRQWSPTALNALAFHSFALSMDKDGDALVRAALSRYENEQSRAWWRFPLNARYVWWYAYARARIDARHASR